MKTTEIDLAVLSAGAIRPTHVLRRLNLIPTQEDRRLALALLGLSLEEGGIEAFAKGLVEAFPDRLQTSTMAAEDAPAGGVYSLATAQQIDSELRDGDDLSADSKAARYVMAASAGTLPEIPADQRTVSYWRRICKERAGGLAKLLRDSLILEGREGNQYGRRPSSGQYVECHPFPCSADWFQDLPGALREYLSAQNASAASGFYQTNVGREIWATLDWCLETRRSGVVEGNSGRGKTATLRAWAAAHRGEVILFTVPGYGSQNDVYKAIARAVGLSNTRQSTDIRPGVEDFLRRSKCILLIDEAHHLLNHQAGNGRPPLIDWINGALFEHGVPVVLCVTPQFARGLARIEDRTGYNADQFRGRFASKWISLPGHTSPDDLKQLAGRLLPQVGAKGVNFAAKYANLSGRDVRALCDLVSDARIRATKNGHAEVSFEDLQQAWQEDRFPSDNCMAASFSRPAAGSRRGSLRTMAPADDGAGAPPDLGAPGEAAPALPAGRRDAIAPLDFPDRSRSDLGAVNPRLNTPGTAPVLDLVRDVESPAPA